jgi:signal transduction histidine kinase
MARIVLIPMATAWVVLWSLVTLLENVRYIHEPSIPAWQVVALAAPSVLVAVSWVAIWMGSPAYTRISLENPVRWFLKALAWTPVLIAAEIVLVYRARVALFALGEAVYHRIAWQGIITFETLRVTLFYILWLGLAFGGKTFVVWQQQRATLLEMQRTLAETQLARLKEQLRPHFLFNTLNTISALMRTDVDRADRLIARLADLLRAGLNVGARDLVPLSAELRFLGLYADIMSERFAGRVTVVWDVAEDALDTTLPALMLQPVLENAFRHGVEATTAAQTITVRARLETPGLCVSVHSTGAGLAPNAHDGVGLRNCRERLRIHYGAAATLKLEDSPAGGVTATVSVPRQEAA